MQRIRQQSGFSLIEVLVVAALSLVIFGALFSSFEYSLDLINTSRAKLSALSIGNDRMEYFRSLPYDAVGVVAGYPSGIIPQTSTTTLNGIEFVERVRVDYIDDPADGLAGADSNAIILDYKQVRLEYTWNVDGDTNSIVLLSNVVPRSIETTAGGGTARINVLNADASLLPGASVRLFSSSSTFVYDVTNITDTNGSTLFNVPADSGYQVEVNGIISGRVYSQDQTYVATTSNPNPVVAPFAVLEADISTLTFQIGELSDLGVRTYSMITHGSFVAPFVASSDVASSSNAAINSGAVVLSDTFGVYETNGIVYTPLITPPSVERWEMIRIAADLPPSTSYTLRLYTGASSSVYTLIPDTELPGNAFGFTDTLIDISQLDPILYPSIVVGISLATSDTTVTPAIEELLVLYRESETRLPNVSLGIRGNKIIGTQVDATPIYKYQSVVVTNGSGETTITDLEFDQYTFTEPAAYDIARACPAHPVVHQAGIDDEIELLLVGDSVDTLRVSVVDTLGRAIPGVNVRLQRSGYDTTITTQSCGQVFFSSGLTANSDFDLTVTATGYTPATLSNVTINGDSVLTVTLTE